MHVDCGAPPPPPSKLSSRRSVQQRGLFPSTLGYALVCGRRGQTKGSGIWISIRLWADGSVPVRLSLYEGPPDSFGVGPRLMDGG